MNRKDTIKLAREAGIKQAIVTPHLLMVDDLERFADLIISHKLDEIADKLQQDFKQSFGADTCASWAAWLRGQK